MPMYEYECKVCGKKESRIVKIADAEEQLCGCEDGVKIDKINAFYAVGVQFKGSGWYNKRIT